MTHNRKFDRASPASESNLQTLPDFLASHMDVFVVAKNVDSYTMVFNDKNAADAVLNRFNEFETNSLPEGKQTLSQAGGYWQFPVNNNFAIYSS